MTHFYRIKEICMNLGIGITALRQKIERGQLPALEHPYPTNTRVAGYSSATYIQIMRKFNLSNETNEANDMDKSRV